MVGSSPRSQPGSWYSRQETSPSGTRSRRDPRAIMGWQRPPTQHVCTQVRRVHGGKGICLRSSFILRVCRPRLQTDVSEWKRQVAFPRKCELWHRSRLRARNQSYAGRTARGHRSRVHRAGRGEFTRSCAPGHDGIGVADLCVSKAQERRETRAEVANWREYQRLTADAVESDGARRNVQTVFLDASARIWKMLSMRAILLLCAVLVVGIVIGRSTAKIGSAESV